MKRRNIALFVLCLSLVHPMKGVADPPAPPPPVEVNGAEGSRYSVAEGKYIEGPNDGTGDFLLQVWYHWYTASDAIYVIGQAHVTITPPAWSDIEDFRIVLKNPQWFKRIGKSFRRGVCKLIKWLPMANTAGGTLAGSVNIDSNPGVNVGGEIGGIGGEGLEVDSAGPGGHHDAEWVVDIGDGSDTAEQAIWADFFALWRCDKDADLYHHTLLGISSAILEWEIDSWGFDEQYRIYHGALWEAGWLILIPGAPESFKEKVFIHQPGKCKTQSFDSKHQECIEVPATPVAKTMASATLDIPQTVEVAWSRQAANVFGIDPSHLFGRAVSHAARRFAALQEQLTAVNADENSTTTTTSLVAQQDAMQRNSVDFAAAIATQAWSEAVAADIATEVFTEAANLLKHAFLAAAQGAYMLSIEWYAQATYHLLEVLYPQFNSGPLTGDCNENGILDDIEIANTEVEDGNTNGIPDECEALPIFPAQPLVDPSSTISLDCFTSGSIPLHIQRNPVGLDGFKFAP